MSTVFLDTVGLLALWDTSDQWHDAAEEAFAGLKRDKSPLVTTTFVLLECGNAAARRPYRQAVDRLRERMESSGMLVSPDADDWHGAWSAYRDGQIGSPSIVDHVSFVVMRRLNITQAFTNDHHFRAAGFETLF
jgi:predicted nucleic acid-binding protein